MPWDVVETLDANPESPAAITFANLEHLIRVRATLTPLHASVPTHVVSAQDSAVVLFAVAAQRGTSSESSTLPTARPGSTHGNLSSTACMLRSMPSVAGTRLGVGLVSNWRRTRLGGWSTDLVDGDRAGGDLLGAARTVSSAAQSIANCQSESFSTRRHDDDAGQPLVVTGAER